MRVVDWWTEAGCPAQKIDPATTIVDPAKGNAPLRNQTFCFTRLKVDKFPLPIG
jgi:hypothetical protein